MAKDQEPHPLDEVGGELRRSKALTFWLYNYLTNYGVLTHTVGLPTHAQRIKDIKEAVNQGRAQHDLQPNEGIFLLALAKSKTEVLKDADIDWIFELSASELFFIWYYLRSGIREVLPSYSNLAICKRHLVEKVQLVQPSYLYSKMAEDNAAKSINAYQYMKLPAAPETEEDMQLCVLEFVNCWCECIESKRSLLFFLKHKTDEMKSVRAFAFAQSCTDQEIQDLWQYLRTRKDMVGLDCESMRDFGLARVVGVFCNWSVSEAQKANAEKASGKYLKDKISKAKSKVNRANLTLSNPAYEKLKDLAGGERKMSAYIEGLILARSKLD